MILYISIAIVIVGIIIIGVFMKYAAIEVDVEMQKDIEAAKKETSFYERMQHWKRGNEIINQCLRLEETE